MVRSLSILLALLASPSHAKSPCFPVFSAVHARFSAAGWRVPAGGTAVRPPLGVTEAGFDQTVGLFRSDPAMQNSHAMVLFGSRTHFESGYLPTEKSDLDIAFFVSDPASFSFTNVLNAFKPLHETLTGEPVPAGESGSWVVNLIPQFVPLKEQLEAKEPGFVKSPLSKQQEREIFDSLEERGRREGWDRQKLVKETKQKFGEMGASIHRESIWVLRKGPDLESNLQGLRRQGFTNIVIVD